jgi:hypothetical protein
LNIPFGFAPVTLWPPSPCLELYGNPRTRFSAIG